MLASSKAEVKAASQQESVTLPTLATRKNKDVKGTLLTSVMPNSYFTRTSLGSRQPINNV